MSRNNVSRRREFRKNVEMVTATQPVADGPFFFVAIGNIQIMLPLLALSTAGFLFGRSLPLTQSGDRISLRGKGPPVLFSSGLFGTMPQRLYTRLFDELTSNMTLVTLDAPKPVTADTARDVCETLGVDSIGLLTHSSLDATLLSSPSVRSAVLFDPVVFPELGTMRLTAPRVENSMPVLLVKAGLSYDADDGRAVIPDYLLPSFSDATVCTYPNVAHADVLDNPWADLASQIFPWMRPRAPTVPFFEWIRSPRTDARERREHYRRGVAAVATRHLLAPHSVVVSESGPNDLLVDLENAAADGVAPFG